MRWLVLTGIFLVGFAAGARRAAVPGRSLLGAAAMLPLLLFLLTGLFVLYLRLTAPVDQGMNDLAYLAVTVIGLSFVVVAFVGGLFGAWFRRAKVEE